MNTTTKTLTSTRRSGKAGWIAALVVFTLLTTVVSAAALQWSMPDWSRWQGRLRIEQATVPPPTHVEWSQYPVGGMVLCQPPDSAGKLQCITIPPGSILAVPRLVEGADPDSVKDQS